MGKLGIHDRAGVVRWALDHELLVGVLDFGILRLRGREQ
jgi:hypothetical protein